MYQWSRKLITLPAFRFIEIIKYTYLLMYVNSIATKLLYLMNIFKSWCELISGQFSRYFHVKEWSDILCGNTGTADTYYYYY